MSAVQPNTIVEGDAATLVRRAPIDHPSAWKVSDFTTPADYKIELDATQLSDIERAVRQIKAAGLDLDELQREHFEVPSLLPVIDEIRYQIEEGRGFVVLRRLPVEDYSKDDLGLIFWASARISDAACRRASWATGSGTSRISAEMIRGHAPTATSRNCRRTRIRATWSVSCACATRRRAAACHG